MTQENLQSLGECTSHNECHYKEDMKIVHEDSWSDSNEDDHEEANEVCLMAVGSQKQDNYFSRYIIAAGAENRPPMLEKSMYDSWASRIRLFIKGKKNGRMMLDSIDEGSLVYPTVVGEDGQTRPKKYSELTEVQQLQDDCDVQATNIILHGLPPDVYALVNHQEAAKDIWDRVKLLMKGTELSYQECGCRLYNLFDKFASVQGETLYEYYWRFSQLINDMHTSVNMNDMLMNYQGDDPIDCINKAISFLSIIASRVTVQQVQGRQTQSFAGTGNRGIATTLRGNYAAGQVKEKLMLVKAQEDAFQTKYLDAYDSDCDDISSAKAILMVNLSSCNSDVLFEESQDACIQDTNFSAPNDSLVLSLVEQMTDHVAKLDKENQTNKMVNESLTAELER
ncbi:hypothetical protein Tco_0337596 [Tanacetum coccineum]